MCETFSHVALGVNSPDIFVWFVSANAGVDELSHVHQTAQGSDQFAVVSLLSFSEARMKPGLVRDLYCQSNVTLCFARHAGRDIL